MRIIALLLLLGNPSIVSCFRPPLAPRRRTAASNALKSTNGDITFNSGQDLGGSSNTAPPTMAASSSKRVVHKDVVIIGGGLAGLSAALYLTQIDPERHVTILEREDPTQLETTVASFAAAGMLAPQSERLPSGPLLELGVASRRLYRDFVNLVEEMAQDCGEEGKKYLTYGDGKVHYVASGGFLAPALAGDSVATWAPPEESGTATWLDKVQVRELEPNLHPDVVGGWWFPEDASVDARRLTCSLRAACVGAGVQILTGASYEVKSLDLAENKCEGVWLENGKYLKTKAVLVANGAWMRNLLPVPVEPHKGQSLSLKMPDNRPPILRRVLFAQDSYIVPKEDGRIVVGATVEAGSFDGNVTPAGLMHIITHALELVPGLKDLPIEETWAGLRPTTPDKGPILGKTSWENLYLAGGYWRNGVLLAPKTGQLVASLIAGRQLSVQDEEMLKAFSWDRFTTPEGAATLAANARYAASFYPVHRRAQGAGVAAAVGTELGSHSSARSAVEERQRDRSALFEGNLDDALERAAEMGKNDATAFSSVSRDNSDSDTTDSLPQPKAAEEEEEETTEIPFPTNNYMASLQPVDVVPYEGSADALTVQSVEDQDLSSIYKSIQDNKASRSVEMDKDEEDEMEDPGFRIYYVDEETGKNYEVPPFTSPYEMEQIVAKDKESNQPQASSSPPAPTSDEATSEDGQPLFDGYQTIDQVNEGKDRMEAMREARMKNRADSDSQPNMNEGQFPAVNGASTAPVESTHQEDTYTSMLEKDDSSDLNSIYEQIRSNKASQEVEMTEPEEEELEMPDYRIYYVDEETGDTYEVPPFTSPGAMEAIVAEKKAEKAAASNDQPEAVNAEEYSEPTFDGYTAIQEANSSEDRQKELDAMREARRKNRMGGDGVDTSKIGVRPDI